jgi:hypothetical protein
MGGTSGDGMWEAVVITMLGSNKQVLFDLLNDARESALKEEEGYTLIYTPNGHQWKQFGHHRLQRPFNSVVLDRKYAFLIISFQNVKPFLCSKSLSTISILFHGMSSLTFH